MRNVATGGARSGLRARRWDVVVVGSSLPGLIAAVRLAMGRLRVLIVEEEAAARLPAGVREPFFLAGAGSGGILDACLRALAVPLIDRRRLASEPIAYQVLLPNARIDVGSPARTAEELVAWGLAKPEVARALARGLNEAAAGEREALLDAPIVRALRLTSGLGRSSTSVQRAPRHARGLPGEVSRPAPELLPWIDAQVRALVNVATPVVPPEARARLLGGALEGGASFESTEETLIGLLRRRFHALHGEIRLLPGRFELVSVGDLAGVAPAMSDEVWFGRALVLNAPLGPLADWLEASGGVPDFLPPRQTLRRRGWAALRMPREVVPEGMARRFVRVGDPSQPLEGANLVRVAVGPEKSGRDVQVIATYLLPESACDEAALELEVAEALLDEMPFARASARRAVAGARPRWDDDLALEDPPAGGGWPSEADLRVLSKPPVYRLPREEVGVLGFEGDCLLGWRAGDAILADLA